MLEVSATRTENASLLMLERFRGGHDIVNFYTSADREFA
jgi:hypothetical protein